MECTGINSMSRIHTKLDFMGKGGQAKYHKVEPVIVFRHKLNLWEGSYIH